MGAAARVMPAWPRLPDGGHRAATVSDVNEIARITGEIASGCPEAFAQLYRAKFDLVYAVARRTTRCGEDVCLDIVQDAMMRVIRYMRPFDDADALDRWLACVTRSVAFDHLRRERRRLLREREAADHRATAADHDARDRDILERLDWVRQELRGLDRVAAEIIELRFRAGLTLEAIGQRLGLTVGAVHGRLMRAVAKLRRKASELGDE